MKRTALITIALAGLTLVGCGSDGTEGQSADTTITASADDTVAEQTTTTAASSSGGSAKDQAADMAISSAAASGMDLDPDCVRDVTDKLSDADAEAIASGNDSAISEAGNALSFELISCADPEVVTDMFIEGMNQSGQNFDEACVREQLQGVDIAELVQAQQGGGNPPADVVAAMTECISAG